MVSSHVIFGSISGAIGNLPIDILSGYLDIARLAMYAVLSINLKFDADIFRLVLDVLINTCRTKPVLHPLIFRELRGCMGFPVFDL